MQDKNGQMNASGEKKMATFELQVNNDYGIVGFDDLLNEIQRMYNVERNIKNNLYSFILTNGLEPQLREFHKKLDMSDTDVLGDCVKNFLAVENPNLKSVIHE